MIELSKIRIDGGTQARAQLDEAVVGEYAELFRAGVELPAITVFFDGSEFWLADGFHRFFAAKQAGLLEIHEDRTPGSRRDAILRSLGANAKHGLRRTNADKRRAVETLLADPEWSAWSSNEIAKRCCVSHTFVDGVRKAILQRLQELPTVRNGTTYEQNTAKIGKAPAPAEPTKPDTPTDQAPANERNFAPSEQDTQQDQEPAQPPDGKSELDGLREQVSEFARSLTETLADNESMARVFEADDRLAAALAEACRFRESNRILESRVAGLMNEKGEAIRLVKSWKRRAERAEAKLLQGAT